CSSDLDWRLISNFEDIAKGRGTTDAQGMLTLALTAAQKAALDAGTLETIIESADARPVTSSFPLRNSFPDADIQFFPEGGELIENTRGKVAFKAIGEKGLGIDVKGEAIDNNGEMVATLGSQHRGMGIFAWNPEAGKGYKAKLPFSNGLKKTVAPPAVKSSAIILTTDNSNPDDLLLRIS